MLGQQRIVERRRLVVVDLLAFAGAQTRPITVVPIVLQYRDVASKLAEQAGRQRRFAAAGPARDTDDERRLHAHEHSLLAAVSSMRCLPRPWAAKRHRPALA